MIQKNWTLLLVGEVTEQTKKQLEKYATKQGKERLENAYTYQIVFQDVYYDKAAFVIFFACE